MYKKKQEKTHLGIDFGIAYRNRMNYIRGRREKEYQKHQRRKKKPFETGFWPVSLPEKKKRSDSKDKLCDSQRRLFWDL
jgi:hypothetical protein